MTQLLTVDQVLQEEKSYRVSWYDAAHTIMLMEIFGPWTWEEAFNAIPKFNNWIVAEGHPVYTIYHYYNANASFFPKGIGGLGNLRKLLEIDAPNEQLIFFVKPDSVTGRLISIVTTAYGFSHVMKKYRFVNAFDEALAQIEQHKQAAKTS